VVHQRGSHARFGNTDDPARIVIVPMGRKNLSIGTSRSICPKAAMRPEDF